MAREGTRSSTGNARPRTFYVPEINIVKPRAKKTSAAGTSTTKKTAGGSKKKTATTTKGTTAAGVRKRKAPGHKTSLGDKVKGELKRVEGALTKNPEKKAAGTKKIRGTDGSKASKK